MTLSKETRDRRVASAKRKLGGKCVKCGSTGYLEFDHIDWRTKVAAVTKLSGGSREKFWLEVQKCQLLCRPCHSVKSGKDRLEMYEEGVLVRKPCGTVASYQRGCRCDACKAARRNYDRLRPIRIK